MFTVSFSLSLSLSLSLFLSLLSLSSFILYLVLNTSSEFFLLLLLLLLKYISVRIAKGPPPPGPPFGLFPLCYSSSLLSSAHLGIIIPLCRRQLLLVRLAQALQLRDLSFQCLCVAVFPQPSILNSHCPFEKFVLFSNPFDFNFCFFPRGLFERSQNIHRSMLRVVHARSALHFSD